jgi:hypothetical protein
LIVVDASTLLGCSVQNELRTAFPGSLSGSIDE